MNGTVFRCLLLWRNAIMLVHLLEVGLDTKQQTIYCTCCICGHIFLFFLVYAEVYGFCIGL